MWYAVVLYLLPRRVVLRVARRRATRFQKGTQS